MLIREQYIDDKKLKLASKIRYEIDPNNEYPKNYTGHIIIKTSNGDVINTYQNGLRGGKNKPLLDNEVEKKFFENLKFGSFSYNKGEKLKLFIDTLFEKIDFSLLN